jgi:hypothetical protein
MTVSVNSATLYADFCFGSMLSIKALREAANGDSVC